MKILDKYILKTHAAPFAFGTVLVVFLFLFQFIFKNIDDLVGKGLGFWVIARLILYNVSWMLVLAAPMGTLFATLATFGNLTASFETTIMKTSGFNLFQMMRPVIFAAAILTVFMYWFNDKVLPETNHRAKVLMMDIKRKKPTFTLESGRFSTELKGYTILARQVDSVSGEMRGATIYDNKTPGVSNIVSADFGWVYFSAYGDKLIVDLRDGEIHRIPFDEEKNYRIVDFKRYQIKIDARGFAFNRTNESAISRGDREMSVEEMRVIADKASENFRKAAENLYKELKKQYKYLALGDASLSEAKSAEKKIGGDSLSRLEALKMVEKRVSFELASIGALRNRMDAYERRKRKYEVEIYKKYSIPFACLIFVFIGAPLGIAVKKGNFGVAATISIGFYIFLWATLIGGEKLADRGYASPLVSMWFGDIAVLLAGVALTLKTNNETFLAGLKLFWEKLFKIFSK